PIAAPAAPPATEQMSALYQGRWVAQPVMNNAATTTVARNFFMRVSFTDFTVADSCSCALRKRGQDKLHGRSILLYLETEFFVNKKDLL
ncbi:MAG TPA: hypothetical protein VN494_03945, partial [Patescibacteria group bacterium]|nr:hypothetical protein [Patescibacteria group bacterium]